MAGTRPCEVWALLLPSFSESWIIYSMLWDHQFYRSCEERIIAQSQWRNEFRTYNTKGKANWIGQVLRRGCLLKHVIEGQLEEGYKWREDEEEDVSNYSVALRKWEDTGNWKGTTRSHCVEKWLWRWLWTCRKTDCWTDGYVLKIWKFH
jgi:hypothetical protein